MYGVIGKKDGEILKRGYQKRGRRKEREKRKRKRGRGKINWNDIHLYIIFVRGGTLLGHGNGRGVGGFPGRQRGIRVYGEDV